jgi:HTH-type transcriptional regulator, sugar sensing transcriptional regulator
MESKDLEKLGLNRNEAKVYFELLKLGNSTASDLVKQMGVHRNIIYDNLEKLIEKGLVSYIIKETKKLFIAQDPSSIIEFLDKKKAEIENEKEIAKELIQEIKKLKRDDSYEQEAQVFRGAKGMKKVLLEILEAKENLVLGMTDKSTELLGETFWKNYNVKVKEKKIKERLLLNSDFKDIYSFSKNKNVQIKILPKELNQVTEIILFGSKVATFIYSDKPLVFLIEDKDLYQTYLSQFEFLWKKSKQINKFK